MKKYILHFIKITLALVLFLQLGEVSAQTISPTNGTVCFNCLPTGWSTNLGSADISSTTVIGYTLAAPGYSWSIGNIGNAPLTNASTFINMSNASSSYDDVRTTITGLTVGRSYSLKFSYGNFRVTPSGSTTNGPQGIRLTIAGTSSLHVPTAVNQWQIAERTFVATATSMTLNVAANANNVVDNFNLIVFSMNSTSIITLCNAGSAPTLSATSINNSSCASPSINLNSLITSTTPTDTTLKWYTSAARTTEVTDPTTVSTSGTYFAFYYDGANNCFSLASEGVTATYTVCPLNIATVCPATTLDLASRIIDAAPTGYTYTYHSATPATSANKLSSSVVSTSGTYYVALYFASQDCYTDTSRPMVVTIVDCCATQAPPTFN